MVISSLNLEGELPGSSLTQAKNITINIYRFLYILKIIDVFILKVTSLALLSTATVLPPVLINMGNLLPVSLAMPQGIKTVMVLFEF